MKKLIISLLLLLTVSLVHGENFNIVDVKWKGLPRKMLIQDFATEKDYSIVIANFCRGKYIENIMMACSAGRINYIIIYKE